MIGALMGALSDAFTAVQAWLFQGAVQPLLYAAGEMRYQEQAYVATEWFLLGLVQVVVLWAVLRPIEALAPAERWADRKLTRVDRFATLPEAERSQRLERESWGLMPDFFVGMLEAASDQARFIDGNENAYYYTSREQYFRAYQAIRRRALGLIPPDLRDKYERLVRVGQALYVDQNFALRQPNTEKYLQRVMSRITLVGALFLGVVAIMPWLVHLPLGAGAGSRAATSTRLVSSTGLLIVVGVVLDTMKQLEAQLLMRHYEGFIRKS